MLPGASLSAPGKRRKPATSTGSYSAYRQRRLRKSALAEGEGFEPPKACTLVVFKTTAIDHSAIPPASSNDTAAMRSDRDRPCTGGGRREPGPSRRPDGSS